MIRLLCEMGERNRTSDKFMMISFFFYYWLVSTHQETITKPAAFLIISYLPSDTYIVLSMAYFIIILDHVECATTRE
jgi:lipid-A-disaccharide synthase-like uncharacterized protein